MTDQDKLEIGKTLSAIAITALGGPVGDPDWAHKTVAATAYNALKHFGCDTTEVDNNNIPIILGEEDLNSVDWQGEYQ